MEIIEKGLRKEMEGVRVKLTYEQWLAAVCIWREARGQSMPAMHGIYQVMRNRAEDEKKRWPRSIAGVIMQRLQFSSMTAPGDANLVKFPVPPLPNVANMDWDAFTRAMLVVESPLQADNTGGANHYESCEFAGIPKPSWAKEEKITVRLGPFNFYKL